MRLKDLQDTLVARMGQREDLRDAVATEFRYAQASLLEGGPFKPWFLLTERSSTKLVPGEQRLALPLDFLREFEDGALYLEYDEGRRKRELKKGDYDVMNKRFHMAGPGEPTSYALTGEYFRLFPTPNQEYTVRMIYYAAQPTLNDPESSNAWLRWAFDVCVGEIGFLMGSYNLDDRKLQEFAHARDRAWKRLHAEHEARMHANIEYVMGGM